MVSVEALPDPARMPPDVLAPGSTTTRLVPSRSICLRTASLAPWPTATMAIKAATPIKTPSMVKAERIMLRQSACMAAAMIISPKLKMGLLRRAAAGNGRCARAADVGLVGDDDDGNALLAIEPRQRLHDFVRIAGVEVAGRFVGEQQAGRVDQGARDRHPLLLAARELARGVALAVAQAEQLERRTRPLDTRAGTRWPGGGVEQRQRNVLERAGAGQKIEALEDEAQAL